MFSLGCNRMTICNFNTCMFYILQQFARSAKAKETNEKSTKKWIHQKNFHKYSHRAGMPLVPLTKSIQQCLRTKWTMAEPVSSVCQLKINVHVSIHYWKLCAYYKNSVFELRAADVELWDDMHLSFKSTQEASNKVLDYKCNKLFCFLLRKLILSFSGQNTMQRSLATGIAEFKRGITQ